MTEVLQELRENCQRAGRAIYQGIDGNAGHTLVCMVVSNRMLEKISRRLRLLKALPLGNNEFDDWKSKKPNDDIVVGADMTQVNSYQYQFEQAISEQDVCTE